MINDEELKVELGKEEKIENKFEDDNVKKKKKEKKETENEMIKIPDWDLEPPFDTIDRGEL
ncbi:MAG: hypothetical protein SPI44_02085 [Bacilli bacterium]|nr:hypothetical protein [Bacilli bacterium]